MASRDSGTLSVIGHDLQFLFFNIWDIAYLFVLCFDKHMHSHTPLYKNKMQPLSKRRWYFEKLYKECENSKAQQSTIVIFIFPTRSNVEVPI